MIEIGQILEVLNNKTDIDCRNITKEGIDFLFKSTNANFGYADLSVILDNTYSFKSFANGFVVIQGFVNEKLNGKIILNNSNHFSQGYSVLLGDEICASIRVNNGDTVFITVKNCETVDCKFIFS